MTGERDYSQMSPGELNSRLAVVLERLPSTKRFSLLNSELHKLIAVSQFTGVFQSLLFEDVLVTCLLGFNEKRVLRRLADRNAFDASDAKIIEGEYYRDLLEFHLHSGILEHLDEVSQWRLQFIEKYGDEP